MGVEDALERFEERIVVERSIRNRAGLQKWRQQHGAGAIAAEALETVSVGAQRDCLGVWCQARAGLLSATGLAGVAIGARPRWTDLHTTLLCLIECDDQQPVASIGGGGQNEWPPLQQKGIGRDESPRLAVLAWRVVTVIAEIRRDEHKIRRAPLRLQILRQLIEVYHAGRANRRVDDGMEVDERVVSRRILVTGWNGRRGPFGALREIRGIQRRMTAGGRLASRVVAHVFHVATPGLTLRAQLIGHRPDRRRVHAAVTDRLAVLRSARQFEVRI